MSADTPHLFPHLPKRERLSSSQSTLAYDTTKRRRSSDSLNLISPPLSPEIPLRNIFTKHSEPCDFTTIYDPEDKAIAAVRHCMRTNQNLSIYNIKSVLGWGANGVVLGAVAPKTGTQVAIKIIYKSRSETIPPEIKVRQFLSESPNLLQYYDHFHDSLAYYLVMENFGTNWPAKFNPNMKQSLQFIDARTFSGNHVRLSVTSGASDLFSFFEAIYRDADGHKIRDVIPFEFVKPIFKQIANGLYNLHRQQIAHVDIKEENVLMAADAGNIFVKLCDYGHCRICTCGKLSSDVLHASSCHVYISSYGTKELTPPEIIENLRSKNSATKSDGFKADVWALGLLMITLLNGALPVACIDAGKSAWSGFRKAEFHKQVMDEVEEIMERTRRLNPSIETDYLHDLVYGMLKMDPKMRSSMEEVMSHLWLED